ncbi:MAG: hypothetical protein R3E84_06295 [Pseudomonadales bacterium]
MNNSHRVLETLLFAVFASASAQATERPSPPTLLTADATCTNNVVLTGYWPATNEMLRPWSTNPAQNPDQWVGRNWHGMGYDVYAFFPEFPPDGNPMNDAFGSDGWAGAEGSDLQVDYQDTSRDFWRIVDELHPRVLITTSRGDAIGWEIERVEGGHGGQGDPSADWSSDRHGEEGLPTRSTVQPRTWAAISTWRGGQRLTSSLPLERIAQAAAALELTSVAIDDDTSGNYLSGFIALHGLYYHETTATNLAAGHIHVGTHVAPPVARQLMEASLAAVLEAFPPAHVACPGRALTPAR